MSVEPPSPDRQRRSSDGPGQTTSNTSAEDLEQSLDAEAYGVGTTQSLAGRVSWALVAEIANAAVGLAMWAVLFFFALGTDGYGAFGAVIAIATIVGPISTFGANWLLTKEVVVSDDIRGDLGRAVSKSLVGNLGAIALVVLTFVLFPNLFDDINRVSIALILLGQVPAFWLIELAISACVAQGKLKLAAQLRLLSSAFRLVALVMLALLPNRSLDQWAWCFAGSMVVSAIVLHAILTRVNGGPPKLILPTVAELAAGIPYGIGNTTEGFLASSDKPILESQKTMFPDASGNYNSGYRIMTMGLIPLMALLRAQDRRFFRQGVAGSSSSHAAAQKLSVMALGATVPVAVVLASAAWVVPEILPYVYGGDGLFEKLEVPLSVIRYLALVPILKGFQFSFGNSLTAADNQVARLLLTGLAAVGNLAANLYYIPRGSWQAAAKTTIGAEICLAIALVAASWHFSRQSPSKTSSGGDSSTAPSPGESKIS